MRTGSKLTLGILSGVLAIPALFAQGPGPDGGQPGPDGLPGMHRRMGPGGQDGERRGEYGRRGGDSRGMGGHHRGHGEFSLARIAANPEMREKLGITAEQAAKVGQQTSEYRKSSIRTRAEVEVKHVELEVLMHADTPDRAAIDRKMDEIGAARLAVAKARIHYRLAMRDVLTAQQRTKLREMREAHMRGMFRERREGAPWGPRGQRQPGEGEE